MSDNLFLLDGMALIYRAHFAFMRNPIFSSKGENTSAAFGFTNTLLDILNTHAPTHIAIAMDTREPTARHKVYPDYKAQREEIPEDIVSAIPRIDQLAAGFRIPVLRYPGFEADDIIGTLARMAETQGLDTYMVTPDKDFAQLVSEHVKIYKPGRQGNEVQILGVPEIRESWQVTDPQQVIDILGLWGDASDNIPGIPGFGEKTAKKLIAEFGSIEELIAHSSSLKGKQKERLEAHGDQALLSKQLATIDCAVPVTESLDDLKLKEPDETTLRPLMIELEFNTLGKKLFGDDFQAGRGFAPPEQQDLFSAQLKTIEDTPHDYKLIDDAGKRDNLVAHLLQETTVCFDLETSDLDPRTARIAGIAFSIKPHEGWYAAFPHDESEAASWLDAFRPFFESTNVRKVGHNLKFDLNVLRWRGIRIEGPLFDTMIAHFLIEPDRRHGMDDLAQQYLGYQPVPITNLIGEKKAEQITMFEVDTAKVSDYACEDADITLQLHAIFEPLLKESGQDEVFDAIEMPLVPVLVDMEFEGIAVDTGALEEISTILETSIGELQEKIYGIAGTSFNLNSPKQLGEILFERLKLVEKTKKTKTGQHATNEQVLTDLAADHEIAQLILDYREATKLKSTYVDALPQAIFPGTGRIHTTFHQTGAATGRLASANPNLQNIPVRTEQGRMIRKAFVSRDKDHLILSADYSQVELRIMADMSGDEGLRQAFREGQDIHSATAAHVYGVDIDDISDDMRRTAKMVNFGIIYGISAFGLGQRLGTGRTDAAAIIEAYFNEFPKVKDFMDRTVAECREKGYVETKSGRRRVIRDIHSSNGTIRAAAERIAINSPIQGTAADMIKIAMARIHAVIREKGYQSRMLLQVHDELVFDLHREEEEAMRADVEDCMKHAIDLAVPVVVEMGTGRNWLDAH